MKSAPSDALEAGLAIARAFEHHRVPYALGGALAYGQYGIPGGTNDVNVDVNVFVDSRKWARLFEALRDAGAEVDEEAARAQTLREG